MPTALAPGSPEWYVAKLGPQLDEQAARVQEYGRWYDGSHPQMFAQERWRKAFGGLFNRFSANHCKLVTDSIAERLEIVGFRVSDSPEGDAEANRIWQRNGMDAEAPAAHVEALAAGIAYALVWGDADGQPRITVEHGSEMIVVTDPGDRRRRTAAMKRYTDEWGETRISLWLPNDVVRLRKRRGSRFQVAEVAPNPVGVVPVVPLVPQRRLGGAPISELAQITPLQGALNKIFQDAIVASEFGAFPQRWATGLTLEEDEEENGRPKLPFEVALDSMFFDSNEDAKFGSFVATELRNYVELMRQIVQEIFTLARLPFHYSLLTGGGNAPSGEAIQSAEAGLSAVTKQRSRQLGENWEEVTRLSFRVLGDSRADDLGMETIWTPAATRSEAVVVDAAIKKAALGVPQRQLWEDVGYTPSQVRRFTALRAQEALQQGLSAPLAPQLIQPDQRAA